MFTSESYDLSWFLREKLVGEAYARNFNPVLHLGMILIAVMIILSLNSAQAQQKTPFELGSWRTYFPAGEYTQMVNGTESIIVANPFQLVLYYPETGEELLINKKNGLSDVGISAVSYLAAQDAIIVGYENGNVDVVTPENTYNIPGIKNNQNILSSKRINNIDIAGDQIFLATDFGVVQIDGSIYEFESTLFTDESINYLEWNEAEGTLYGASEAELYILHMTANTNLADINQWNIIPIGSAGSIQDMVEWKAEMYLVSDERLWKWEDMTLIEIPVTGAKVRFIRSSESHLLVVNEFSNIFTWNGRESIQYVDICHLYLRDVLMIDPETFWYLKKEEFGLYTRQGCETYSLPGVPSRFVTEMAVMNSDLYVATGGVNRIYNNLFREDGFYTNASGDWKAYNIHTTPDLEARNMRDVYTVEKNTAKDQVYFGTFWDGVIRYDKGELTIFDESNSSLQFSVTNPDRIRVADLFLDQKENLWVANHDAIRPLSVMTSSGEWKNFSISVNPRIEKLVVDEYQNIWMAIAERGLYIFRPNDWDKDGDDQSRLIIPQPGDGSGTGFDNARINEIVIDRTGGVWLGTESGPVLFNCGDFAFDDICQGRKPVIEVNGQLGVLLRNENVKAIAIDGGNRKWFGTDNGVYVISAAVDRIDHHFHTDNSPLPDNSINDITIDPVSGEVYIATDEGLVSYRGEATESKPGVFAELAIYPNPVPPSYTGVIGVKNLGENSLVRITTLSGRLIYENRAIGGQLVWDRRDQDGRQVASGIYLVYATRDQSATPYTQVGKIFMLD